MKLLNLSENTNYLKEKIIILKVLWLEEDLCDCVLNFLSHKHDFIFLHDSRFRRKIKQIGRWVQGCVSSSHPAEILQVTQPSDTHSHFLHLIRLFLQFPQIFLPPADRQFFRMFLWLCGSCCGCRMSCFWVSVLVCCQPPPPC